MSSEVKISEADFMEDKSETESLKLKLREIEDENHELRTQNLLQNRTIIDMRNELILLRIQFTEMADTSSLLRERVRNLTQNSYQVDETNSNGLVTAPPLMPPDPVPPPPPLPPARIRISPRQVGAGEALTTPLGISLSSPPRHRVKRDVRQGFYRPARGTNRRLDSQEPGPSSPPQMLSNERPNYFVGLRIIPQFQTSFVCAQNQNSSFSDSVSDSSGSDENPQVYKKIKTRALDGESSKKSFSREFNLLKNVKNIHHQKVRQNFLQNYNLSLPSTNSKFFFPIPWDRSNSTMPSTSRGNEYRYNRDTNFNINDCFQGSSGGARNSHKISDCAQYTFPTIHEGLHPTVVLQTGETVRLRKSKKSIPYSLSFYVNEKNNTEFIKKEIGNNRESEMLALSFKGIRKSNMECDSESVSSVDEPCRATSSVPLSSEMSSDFDQDGFQADESSNCLTSNENSLERIVFKESKETKKNGERS